jgi:hypothetical protein
MLINDPPKYRRRLVLKWPPAKASAGPVAPPVLVSATYNETISVTLTFDRAVSMAGLDPAAITIDDGTTGFRYGGTEANQSAANSVEILLNGLEEQPFTGVHLTATDANGIVAVEDDVAWAGVTELALPFP